MTADTDRSIETLIRLAGEREMPAAPATERARAAAEESWRRMLACQPPPALSRPLLPLAFAAALALAVLGAVTWWPHAATNPPVPVARVVALSGTAALLGSNGRTGIARGAQLLSGTTLATREGRVAVAFADALSLRLDRDTQLRFDARYRVTLLRGALYVDSGGLGAGPPLVIVTPAGEVRHVGTQFQVGVSGDTTRIRVREGRVSLKRLAGDGARVVAPGDELEMQGGQERWRHGLASFGDEWEWATAVAPTLAIEDRPLAEFLAWMAREHGWHLRYVDDGLQQRTLDIRLHGSLEGLEGEAMLERVALVTGIQLVASEGAIWVGGRPR